MKSLELDIESFSSNDLIKGGVYKYVEAEDFEMLYDNMIGLRSLRLPI